jgi:hypothetical protein
VLTTFEALMAMLAVSGVCALWAIWTQLKAVHQKLDRIEQQKRD